VTVRFSSVRDVKNAGVAVSDAGIFVARAAAKITQIPTN